MADERASLRKPVVAERRPAVAARVGPAAATARPVSVARAMQQRLGNRGTQAVADHIVARSSVPSVAPARTTGIGSLSISQPGDAHEREAESVADLVMRMPAPAATPSNGPRVTSASSGDAIQRRCAECETESKEATVYRDEAAAADTPQLTPAVTASIRALQGGGSPLPASTREFFEPRFGADFSQVRLHTDARAADTAKSINAKAFTVGRDIAFGAGRYAPESSEGRHLLAHELTHVVQQKGGRAPDVIQRDIGVEFQADNVISQNKGNKKFDRIQTKNKPLKKVGGLSMEVDTGSVMEFGTGHYKRWSELKKDLDAVTAIITDIKGLPKEALDPAKPVTTKNPLVFRGFNTDHGKVDVTAEPADFSGKPQTNEDIALSDFGSLLKENVPAEAATVVTEATGAIGKATTANLTGFMQMIVFHLRRLQRDSPDLVFSDGEVRQPKGFMSLLNKTDYTAMFQSLTAKEQQEFKNLVKADPNPIAAAAGASMKDDLFKVGYWGWHPDRSAMRVLIKEGKIVRIKKDISGVNGEGTNMDIHTCGNAGVPARYCKTSQPIERVTVGAWLKSMIKPSNRTQRSVSAPLPTYSGAKGGGFSWGLSKASSTGTVLMEVRNHDGKPIAAWPNFVEKNFNVAANCRPGSKLTYDGNKPKPTCP